MEGSESRSHRGKVGLGDKEGLRTEFGVGKGHGIL